MYILECIFFGSKFKIKRETGYFVSKNGKIANIEHKGIQTYTYQNVTIQEIPLGVAHKQSTFSSTSLKLSPMLRAHTPQPLFVLFYQLSSRMTTDPSPPTAKEPPRSFPGSPLFVPIPYSAKILSTITNQDNLPTGGLTARPDSNSASPPTTRFEESLHYVRIEQTTRNPLASASHSRSRHTLAYPHPPSPPNSDTPAEPDSDDEIFHSAQTNFSSEDDQVTNSKNLRPIRSAYAGVKLDDDAATAVTGATTTTYTTNSSATSSKRARARMAAKAVSKPIRRSYVGMVAGLASTVGLGQAMFLKATYQSPPDARGPRSGVERPLRRVETLSSAEGHVARIIADNPTSKAATNSSQVALGKAVDAAIESAKLQLHDLDLSPIVEKQGGRLVTRHRRILIIGDSLVSGVGGESSFDDGPSDGPALPRQVARYLSEMLNVDVQWNAMSLTGGDVRMLKRKIIPMLTRERARGTIGDISAVVLVTGVNDWKRISPFRTANKFKEDLAEFINKIREQVGDHVSVFLPAIPGVHHTPRFHDPLRSILIFLNDYWDSQKVQLSRCMRKVYFVGQFPNEEWGTNPIQYFSTLDRVHPSELGYQRWARRIAEHMVAAFHKGMKAANLVANEAVSNATQKASFVASTAVEQATDVAEAARADMSNATNVMAAVTSSQQTPQSA